MIIGAKLEGNVKEREKVIKDAISLCKDVAAKLNLDILVSHLVAVHSYIGALEICLASASKRAPQGLALHYYKNGEPPEDLQGSQAFVTRSNCYSHITRMLKCLMTAAATLPTPNFSSGKNSIPGPSRGPPMPSNATSTGSQEATTLGPAQAEIYLDQVCSNYISLTNSSLQQYVLPHLYKEVIGSSHCLVNCMFILGI